MAVQAVKSKDSIKLYMRLLAYAKEYRWRVVLTWFLMILSGAMSAFVVLQLKPILNGAFVKTDDPAGTFHKLLITILLTMGAALMMALSRYGQDYFMGFLGQQVIQKLRNNLYSHFLVLPMSYFNSKRTGELAARITNDVQVLQDSIKNIVGNGASSGITSLFLIGLLIHLDWKLAILALVVFPLVLYPIYSFGRKIRRASTEGQQLLADLNSQIHETLMGIRVVKAFGMEDFERHKFKQTNEKFFGVAMRSIRAYAASSPIVETIGYMVFFLLILWMAYRVMFLNNFTIGDFGTFTAGTLTLYPRLKDFNGVWGGLQSALASAERCFAILDTEDPMVDVKGAVEVAPLRKAIEFKNVSFEYIPGHPILKDISFKIEKGEVLALVGPSGGGKTTLADLIPRFYQPTKGQILWDGQDISKVKLASLRSRVGIVTQETILFHESIMKNIAYGRPAATFWDVQKAAEDAYAKEFIANTSQGFNTVIGDRGLKLSGGQRQRLAIARAILKNPPVMILDEATSALDTQSEHWVQMALNRLMGNRTTLVIAHRLSTVRKADRILVIDKGRIAEQGKHASLVHKGGLYSKLYKMQFRTPSDMKEE
jgi:subfamily B ATP-binding cassette protein MsbA